MASIIQHKVWRKTFCKKKEIAAQKAALRAKALEDKNIAAAARKAAADVARNNAKIVNLATKTLCAVGPIMAELDKASKSRLSGAMPSMTVEALTISKEVVTKLYKSASESLDGQKKAASKGLPLDELEFAVQFVVEAVKTAKDSLCTFQKMEAVLTK